MRYRNILIGVLVVGVLTGSALLLKSTSATNYQVITLSTTAASQTQVNVTCSNAPSGYVYIYRDGSYWGYIGCPSGGFAMADAGKTCGISYSYYAEDSVNASYYSNTVSGTPDACTPGVPTIGTNTPASQTAFTTTWSRNAPLNESGFEVNSSLTPFPANAAAGATSYTGDWAVSCNTTGNNSVRSFINTNGRTYYSNMSAASNNATTDACTPAAPTMTSASTVNQTQAIVYFTDNSTNETGFYIMTSGGSQMGSSGAIGGTGSPTAGYATGLSCGTSYYFYADAYVNTNGRAYRGSSAWSNLVTIDQCTPGMATIGSATATGQTTATVTWTRNAPFTETGFNIWDQTPTFRGSAGAGATSGSATGLSCGTSYAFRVVSYVDTNGRQYTPGQSGQTNTITTNACNNPPNTPTPVSPPNGSWTNSRTFSAQVSDPDGGTVRAEFMIGGTWYYGNYVTSGGTSVYSFSGDYNGTWYARAYDGSLNSGNTATWTAHVDTVPPTANITGNSVNEATAMTLNSNGADTGGSGVASYAWYSGTACSGTVLGTASTYSAGTQNEPYTTDYAVKVTDNAGNSACVTASATWNNVAPTASGTGGSGPENTSVSVSVAGSDPGGTTFTYQWFTNSDCSGLIGGATNSTYNAPAQNEPTSITYYARVYDAQVWGSTCGGAPATATWTNVAPTANAVSSSFTEGGTCTLNSSVSDPGGTTFSYAWYVGSSCGGSSLGSGSSYTTPALAGSTVYSYKTWDAQSLASSCVTATCNVTNVLPTPSPVTCSVQENQACVFTANASDPGNDITSYNWYSGGACGGSSLGTVSTYSAGTQTEPATAAYSYKACDAGGCSATCATANATWTNVAPNVAPTNNGPVDENSSITFSANASDPGGTTFTYQWYSDACATAISGATGSTRAETLTEPGTLTRYVKAWDAQGLGSACSSGSTGTWNNVAPTVSPSNDGPKAAGTTVTFSANASDPGGTTFTYQWYTDASCASSIGGATASTYAMACSYPSVARYVKAWDAQSAPSSCGASTATCTITNTAPNTPTPTSPPDNTWTTSRQFCATVSDPDGGNVTAYFVLSGVGTFAGSTVTSGSSSCYTHTADLNGVTWYAYAQDPQSATSGNSATRTAKIDTAAPTPNPPTTSGAPQNQTQINWSMSAGSDSLSGLHSTPYGFSTNGSTYNWQAGTTWNETGLVCNTSYTRYGKIRDAVLNETSAGSGAATTAPCTPAAPTSLTQGTVTGSSIAFSWTDNATNETGFSIERCSGAGCSNFAEITTVGQNVVNYTNSSLACATSFSYRVRAYVTGAGGPYYSSYTNTITASTQSCNNPPNTPTPTSPPDNTWTTSRQFCATVSDPDGGNVTAYFVLSGVGTFAGSTVTSGSSSCYTHTADLNGVTWYAYAQDPQSATSGNSATRTAKIDTAAPTPNPPTLSCGGITQTSIAWTLSSGSDSFSGLHATPYGFSAVSGGPYNFQSGATWNESPLTCGTNYTRYGVIRDAVSNQTSQGSTACSTASCGGVNAPSAASGASAVPVSGRAMIDISWSDAADGVLIYEDEGIVSSFGLKSDNTTLNSDRRSNLKCPKNYQYKLVAYNSDTSLGGATDPSCQNGNLSFAPANDMSNKKCAVPATISVVKIRFCTQGFFGD